jgi:hypothetical protein
MSKLTINMENFDCNEESNYIVHLDANNLYGWITVQSLPDDKIKIGNIIYIDKNDFRIIRLLAKS